MRFKDLSIRSKLVLLQLLVVFVVLVLYSVFHIFLDVQVHREAISSRLSSMADIIGYNCISALDFLDAEDASRTLRSLEAEANITHAWILDGTENIFASYRRKGQKEDRPVIPADGHEEMKGKYLYLSRGILQQGDMMGSVVLRYDMTPYRNLILYKGLAATAALTGGLVVAFFLALLTQRALTGPMDHLVDTIEKVSRTRDLSIRAAEGRRDEIGVLYTGFNTMLSEIQTREVERDSAIAALRESEDKYRTLVEGAKDGIVIIQYGRFVYANPALVEMSGYPIERLIGSEFIKHIAPEEVPRLQVFYKKRMSGVEADARYETIFLDQDGQYIHAEVNAALITYQGEPADLVIIRNINERKKAEAEIRKLNETLELRVKERTRELAEANEKLIELDRMKSMFLASMSHELRTPLNSILGFTGLLLMGMSGELNKEQTKQLSMVQTSAEHLLNLINDILDISKIESGKVDLTIETFALSDLVEDVLKSVRPIAEPKGLELISDIPEDLTVESDRRRIKQILVNLIGNAIKFSEKGSITVNAGRDKNNVLLSISDQGIGIRKEDLDKLFIPFQQIDMSSTKAYEGTGLGLYLCRKILTLLHGEISAQSEYGSGSTFSFSIPLTWEEL
ncbi:MAG TPA: ATP-binding protein [Thermoanaerobaculia bacterium]|nr:ATP-binding protein [Thermoanaerobaculia bacterium]HUM30612.1 ATP-binding protein [Thermoanaerobaculia bacterium]HXK68860.1 ATP-binding protein [Thermoanaerobaculia bacterium]